MDVNSISGLWTSATATGSKNQGIMGRDDFLNLLITELKYQDPMNPMEDRDFIAQMAQFSALEAMQNVEQKQTLALIGSLLDREVRVEARDPNDSRFTRQITGVLGSLAWGDKGAILRVGAHEVEMKDVVSFQVTGEGSW